MDLTELRGFAHTDHQEAWPHPKPRADRDFLVCIKTFLPVLGLAALVTALLIVRRCQEPQHTPRKPSAVADKGTLRFHPRRYEQSWSEKGSLEGSVWVESVACV